MHPPASIFYLPTVYTMCCQGYLSLDLMHEDSSERLDLVCQRCEYPVHGDTCMAHIEIADWEGDWLLQSLRGTLSFKCVTRFLELRFVLHGLRMTAGWTMHDPYSQLVRQSYARAVSNCGTVKHAPRLIKEMARNTQHALNVTQRRSGVMIKNFPSMI